ncbi:hybrid sensor histidine kinase/response regulator [Halorientalis pallida]|uniref:histidine kinase n=1 Tax=Halorientalis pallida TaxID=2479928 RepID=A0A498KVL2_9EURY|nr:PAS domain S-box protein [Halorientalis pallida]RXK49279.1 PAS domain S-box protein [Halorientalis pallida]
MRDTATGTGTDAATAGWGINVLCVDDEPDVLELTASFLERENERIATTTTTSASDALGKLGREPVDCVVSDYQMPQMDGLTFLDRVRSEYDDLPFVLFTGKGSEEIASQAISRGVTDYLQKKAGAEQYAVLANCVENAATRHRAQSRLESFLHSAPYGIVISDVAGRIHQVNRHLQNQFGYDRDELLGEPIERLLPERYHEDHVASREAYVEDPDRRPMGAEHDLWGRRQDGTEFPVEITLCPIDLDSGLEIVASIHDVSAQRVRDDRLELAETLFENTQDALFVIDVDEADDEFRLQRVNPVYETNTGLSSDHLCGRRLRDVFGDEVGGEILDHYRECVARREPIEYVEWVSVPEMGPYWETRIAPVIIDGTVEQLVGATRNVTAQREREIRYDAIFNQTYQFTGLMDTDGRLLEANETALEFGDLDRDSVVEKPIWETMWFRDGDVSAETLRDLVERASAGEFVRAELEVAGADGPATIDFSIKPITDETGEVVLLLPEGRDITERKRRERELKRQNARLDEFAAVVSHDLRNPLNVAIGSLELGRRSGDPVDFDRVEMAHGRMNALISDLLELARNGKRVEETTTIHLGTVLESVWGAVHTERATLESAVGDFQVEADNHRLSQLLQNLLANAVQHGSTSPPSRTAEDATAPDAADVADETPDATVRVGVLETDAGFYVADDGPGIPTEERSAVFEHGYSTSSRGTGFGLSIVRSIAEAHGWTVRVRDSATGGARFEVVVDPNGSTEA